MNFTGILSVYVSLMWLNVMNISDCNTWQLSATRYGTRVRWLFPRSQVFEIFVMWFTVDFICFASEKTLIYMDMTLFFVSFSFLAHLSWKLKWAFLITCRLSSVFLSVRLSVNFSHFHLLLQNHWANYNQTWHKVSLGCGDSSLFKWRAKPFPKGR